jgi:RHS repeat-associated protein
VYNALGQRVEMKNGAGTSYTELAYDGFGNMIALHNRTTTTQRTYYLGGRPFARHQDNKTYFLHPNNLGSTTFVTDQTGATIQKTIYYPWGQAWATAGSLKDNRFASLDPRDAETGNDPTLFRMYNPRLYRWLSPDPLAGSILNPQSLNRYAYVLNNPVNFIDPLGLDVWGCVTDANGEDICGPITFTTSWGSSTDFTGGIGGSGHPMHAPMQEIGWLREPGGAGGRGIQVRPDGSIWIYQPASQICTNQGGCYDSVEARWVNVNDLAPEDRNMVILALSGLLAEGPVNLAAVGTAVVPLIVVAGPILGETAQYAAEAAFIFEATHPGCIAEFMSGLAPAPSGASTPCYAVGFAVGNAIEWLKKR